MANITHITTDESSIQVGEYKLHVKVTGVKGDKGDKGETGATGPAGAPGQKGEKGEQGSTGPAGKDGINGRDGIDGTNGVDGKDGKDGKDGTSISITKIEDSADGKTHTITFSDNNTLVIQDGADGKDGVDGKDGASGSASSGESTFANITSAAFNDDGDLILTLSNNEKLNAGKIKPIIFGFKIDEEGNLVAYTSEDTMPYQFYVEGGVLYCTVNGAQLNLGSVKGEDGKTGEQGPQGPAGKDGVQIDDNATTGADKTWSIDKFNSKFNEIIATIENGIDGVFNV